MPDKPFLTDIESIRKRAREHIDRGAVTPGYTGDRQTVLKLLNEALATEIVCTLRYKVHYFKASGLNSQAVKAEFLEHAQQEQVHADRIAERIVQLGGTPNFNPEGMLSRAHADYVEGEDLIDMIREDLVAERVAIDTYRAIVAYIGGDDPTTRRIMEEVLAEEEEHAEDMASLLAQMGETAKSASTAQVQPAAANPGSGWQH